MIQVMIHSHPFPEDFEVSSFAEMIWLHHLASKSPRLPNDPSVSQSQLVDSLDSYRFLTSSSGSPMLRHGRKGFFPTYRLRMGQLRSFLLTGAKAVAARSFRVGMISVNMFGWQAQWIESIKPFQSLANPCLSVRIYILISYFPTDHSFACSLLQAEKASGVFGKAQCFSKQEVRYDLWKWNANNISHTITYL